MPAARLRILGDLAHAQRAHLQIGMSFRIDAPVSGGAPLAGLTISCAMPAAAGEQAMVDARRPNRAA